MRNSPPAGEGACAPATDDRETTASASSAFRMGDSFFDGVLFRGWYRGPRRPGRSPAALAPEAVADLHQEDVVARRAEERVRVAAELEVAGVAQVLPLLGPGHVERGARPPLPAVDGVHAQRLEVEVGVVECEGGRGAGAVGVDHVGGALGGDGAGP